MKVVCESCHAKYQVPDARVAGKKLKIRCKRCGETVLIRGDLYAMPGAQEGDEGATIVAPASATGGFAPVGSEWHVSVEGQVSGPFSSQELVSWLATSAAGWDAFVWREGFGEWIEARACDEIVTAAGGAPTSVVAATGTEEEQATRMFQGAQAMAAMGGQAHAAQSGGYASQVRAQSGYGSRPSVSSRPARPQSSVGSIPPASQSRPPRAGSSVVPSSPASRALQSRPPMPRAQAASPRAGSGEVDESILFSTQKLQQVAQTASQPPGYLAAQSRPGYAAGEGSGLVDIRALAMLAKKQQSVPPRAISGIAPDDGKFSFGDEAHPQALLLSPAVAANRIDSLAPVAAASRKKQSSGVPIAIFGGFALLAASAFAAIMLTRAPAATAALPPTTAPAAKPVEIAAAAQPVAAEPSAVKAEPEAPAAAEPVAAAVAEPAAAEEETAKPEVIERAPTKVAGTKAASKRRQRNSRTASEDDKPAPAPTEKKAKEKEKAEPTSLDDVMLASAAPAKKEEARKEEAAPAEKPEAKETKSADLDDLLGDKPAAKAPEKERSIDDLIDGAVAKKPKAAAPAAAPASDLPESPSRDQVLSAMRGVESQVRACANGITGTALVQLEVDGSTGHVSSSDTSGVDDPAAGCISKAARNAKFPRFSKPSFTVKFPYRLK